MIPVNIATLKAKLSYYLGQVRLGHEVLVMDRKTPVAIVSPSGAHQGLLIVPAKKSPSGLGALRMRPVKKRVDPMGVLRQDRERR